MSDGGDSDRYLAKARECRAGAASEHDQGRYNNSANRAYYACFHAAIAALLRIGVGPSGQDDHWRHDAVQAQFVDQLINRRKHYSADLRETLGRGAILRATADYRTDLVSETQSIRSLRRSRAFLDAVEQQRDR